MQYLLDRLKERSTWLGLIGIATAFGVALTPEQVDGIVALGAALAGAVAVFTKDPAQ